MILAPWSNLTEGAASTAANSSLTLAEIQKAERERRAEQYRLELAQQQTQALLEQQQQKEAVLKWKLKPQNQAKSLAEIQAEESKARQTIQQTTAVNVRTTHTINLISVIIRWFSLFPTLSFALCKLFRRPHSKSSKP